MRRGDALAKAISQASPVLVRPSQVSPESFIAFTKKSRKDRHSCPHGLTLR